MRRSNVTIQNTQREREEITHPNGFVCWLFSPPLSTKPCTHQEKHAESSFSCPSLFILVYLFCVC